MEMGRCDSQFCAWIDTADSRDRQQEHRYQERIREQVFLDCLHVHTSSAELSSAIEQGAGSAAFVAGRNFKDLLCRCGERLLSGTWCIPCDLCLLKWVLALQCATFLIATQGSSL